MSVDLDFIESPGSGSNGWVWLPSDDDLVDADNWQYILDESKTIAVVDQIPARIEAAEGLFYVRKEIEIPDHIASMFGNGIGSTIIQFGTKAGGPMDLLEAEKALRFNESLIPSGLVLYNELGGGGGDFSLGGLTMKTAASTNARLGTQWTLRDFTDGAQDGTIPWDNANIVSFVMRCGLIDTVKTGIAVSLSAPDGEDKQTLVSVGARFTVDDVGRPITIFKSPQPENDGIFEISDYVSPTSVKFVNASGASDAVGNFRWASVIGPLPIPRSNLTIRECRFEGDHGDPVSEYGETPVSNVELGISAIDWCTSVVEGIATPPTNSDDTTYESQFGVVDDGGGARYFWHDFATRIVNGDTIIEDCEFHRVGSAWVVQEWPETATGLTLELPSNAQRVKTSLKRNRITQCGLTPFNGSNAMAYVLTTTGDVAIEDNIIDDVVQSNHVGNALTGIVFNHGPIGTIRPEELVFFGATLHDSDIGSRSGRLRFVGNEIDMGYSGVTGAEPWAAVVIRGVVEDGIGDPNSNALWAEAVFARNKLLGGCKMPLRIRGQNSIVLTANEFGGLSDSEIVRLAGCANIRFDNSNVFHVRPSPFTIVMEDSVNDCAISDDLDQRLRILALGRSIEVRKVVEVTEDGELPVDPADSRPFAPV